MKNNALIAFILMLFPSMIFAASMRISPISVEILDTQNASSISLYNQSNESTDLQVRVFEWTQKNGQDVLTPTDDIAVSPPILSLQADDSFNLRVVRVDSTPVLNEKAYRIIIDELPKPIDHRKADQGLNILLRSSLPMFITNKNATSKIEGKINTVSDNSFAVINNTGSRHILLSKLVIIDKTENKSYPIKVTTLNGYLLAGQTKNYFIENFKYQQSHQYMISTTVNGKDTEL